MRAPICRHVRRRRPSTGGSLKARREAERCRGEGAVGLQRTSAASLHPTRDINRPQGVNGQHFRIVTVDFVSYRADRDARTETRTEAGPRLGRGGMGAAMKDTQRNPSWTTKVGVFAYSKSSSSHASAPTRWFHWQVGDRARVASRRGPPCAIALQPGRGAVVRPRCRDDNRHVRGRMDLLGGRLRDADTSSLAGAAGGLDRSSVRRPVA